MKPATKRIAAGAAALFCIAAASAVGETKVSPGHNAIVIPDGAPLRFESFGRDEIAKFKGRFELRGTYRYGYVSEGLPARSRHIGLALSFAPDLPLAEKLPYWRGLAPPAALDFSNARTFVRRVIPADAVAKLKQKAVLSVSGRAAILVQDYRAGIQCGDARYSVR
ncbi:MAG TPA: hypothetical protein VGG69_12600, partial [Rhizomicrobium sp.]